MEINYADGLRHLYVPSLNKVSSITKKGFRDWLRESSAYRIMDNISNDTFSISCYDYAEAVEHVAYDINRLSCAALETIFNTKESSVNRKSLGWTLIQVYYSAFFSAHSLLKILGYGLIQIDGHTIDQIKQREAVFGVNVNLSSGVYCSFFDERGSRVLFKKVSAYDDSHKGLWRRFTDILDVLQNKKYSLNNNDPFLLIQNTTGAIYRESVYKQLQQTDAIKMAEYISKLQERLRERDNYSWLSTTRNLINYSHQFGIWYPYSAFLKEYEKIDTLRKLFPLDPFDKNFYVDNEMSLLKYMRTCQLVNSVNFEILQDLRARHPENKSFLEKGVFAFHNLYSAKNLVS